MASASVLCSTSEAEGFPNTFLEAWSVGLPVVSTWDPDGLIRRKDLGLVGKSVDDLAAGLASLLASPREWQDVSQRVRRHYLETYTVDRVVPRFEDLFHQVVDTGDVPIALRDTPAAS